MIASVSNISLNSVTTVTATSEPDVFLVKCNITDIEGSSYDTDYCSRPNDPFGLNPTIRQWLADNPSFPIQSYVAPTPQQIRASMLPLSARQLRLGLVNLGISPSQVEASIVAMASGLDKDKTLIEWEYATAFNRTHTLIATISAHLGLSDEQVDAMWIAAINL
ncbi:hypothetical protein I6F26_13635 [Ensifer sp. IC3342]|nr:hypothetical protein [Ensifer sp. BRP08]MCA1447620.1 hypothetical protein [Ensifer sp. IC3342]